MFQREELRFIPTAPPPPQLPPPIGRLIFPRKKLFCETSSTTCHGRRKFITPETSRKLPNSDPKGAWLLMIGDDDNDDDDDSWSELGKCCYLWNPVTLEKIELPNLKPYSDLSQQKFGLTHCVFSSSSGASICYSKGGWLLMSKGEKKLFFFNPFTKRKIKLPNDRDSRSSRMSFSSSPTSSDCVVFAIYIHSNSRIEIRSIRRGQDSWYCRTCKVSMVTSAETRKEFVTLATNPIFLYNAFYCLDLDGSLVVFRSKNPFGRWRPVDGLEKPSASFSRCFLVECDENLLSVFIGDLGEGIKIFRLDSVKKQWVKVESLGKHVLFISDNSCISTIASNNSTENTVYFSRFHGERILFYSLKTGMYHSVGGQYSAENFYNTKNQLQCSWIEPNWSQNTDEELDYWF